jgi:hypothetical protein
MPSRRRATKNPPVRAGVKGVVSECLLRLALRILFIERSRRQKARTVKDAVNYRFLADDAKVDIVATVNGKP